MGSRTENFIEIRAGTNCPEVTAGPQQSRDTQTGVLGNELRSGGIRKQRNQCTQLESGGIQGWECRCTRIEVRGDSGLGMPVHPG